MRIACISTKDFEDDELAKPRQALLDEEHQFTLIAPKMDPISGKRGTVTFKPDLTIDDANVDDYDALFIPGGFSPDQLRADDRFVSFVRDFGGTGKPVFAICHGPQLLLTAGLLDGHTVTAWKTVQDDLRRAGIHVLDEEVVVDDNLVTSRQPSDIPAFNRAIIEVLETGAADSVPKLGEMESFPSLH